MKVLLVNGSPHQKGCTYTALSEVADALVEEGIETDFYWIGNKPIGGCIGCFQCAQKQKCIFDDKVNEITALAVDYDGFIFGSPVYYSGMNGSLMSFMDRVFFSASAQRFFLRLDKKSPALEGDPQDYFFSAKSFSQFLIL